MDVGNINQCLNFIVRILHFLHTDHVKLHDSSKL